MPPPEEIETEDDDDLGPMSPGGAGLVGIKVVSSIEDIRVEGVEVMGVEVVGLPLLDTDAFHERMGRFWGCAPDMDTFNAVTREIILYYREQGFRVVDATWARQKLSTGVLQILVVEGKLNEANVDGARWF